MIAILENFIELNAEYLGTYVSGVFLVCGRVWWCVRALVCVRGSSEAKRSERDEISEEFVPEWFMYLRDSECVLGIRWRLPDARRTRRAHTGPAARLTAFPHSSHSLPRSVVAMTARRVQTIQRHRHHTAAGVCVRESRSRHFDRTTTLLPAKSLNCTETFATNHSTSFQTEIRCRNKI